MKTITYKGNVFNYYKTSKYSGKSIITGYSWLAGTPIYWNIELKCGFTEEEALTNNLQINEDNFHHGSTNKNITYDDSKSRDLTKKLFKKQFNIDLVEPQSQALKINDKYFNITDGQFCIDLCAVDHKNEQITALVEVERSTQPELFDVSNTTAAILASKYWKYFHSYNTYLTCICYINEEINKACIIMGMDIKNGIKTPDKILIKDKIKEVYRFKNIKKRIYDLSE